MTRLLLAVLIAATFLCAVLYAHHRNTVTGHQGPSDVTVGAAQVVASPVVQPPIDRRPHLRRASHPIRAVTLDTTAYCESGSRTASGVYPQRGMAASNLFPFGQRLRVPGIGIVTVTDRIGYGSQLDIYMGGPGCEQRALAFGRRSLLVEVLP